MNKNTLRVISIMTLIVLAGFAVAHFYYKDLNSKEDPRVVEAKYLYGEYSNFSKEKNYKAVLETLQKIEQVYAKEEHYKNSFEVGVVLTDKAAFFITLAIYKDSLFVPAEHYIDELEFTQDSLFNYAEMLSLKSIEIYEHWLLEFASLDAEGIREKIKEDFTEIDASENQKEDYLNRRINDILAAQIETPRRLSVSYTNLGIVKRHKEKYTEAAEMYKKALQLWDKNMAAKNNMNILLGRPLEKANIIDQLFPPERIGEKDTIN